MLDDRHRGLVEVVRRAPRGVRVALRRIGALREARGHPTARDGPHAEREQQRQRTVVAEQGEPEQRAGRNGAGQALPRARARRRRTGEEYECEQRGVRDQRVLVQERGAEEQGRAERVEQGEPYRPPLITEAGAQEQEHRDRGDRAQWRHESDLHAHRGKRELDVEAALARAVHEERAVRPVVRVGRGRLRLRELRPQPEQQPDERRRDRVRQRARHRRAGVVVDEGAAPLHDEQVRVEAEVLVHADREAFAQRDREVGLAHDVRREVQRVDEEHGDADAPGKAHLVLHHVRREDLPVRGPARIIEFAVDQAVAGRVRHEQRMVRVVVREQPLPAEHDEAVEAEEPVVDPAEVLLVAEIVDRVGMRQPARLAAPHRRGHGKADALQPSAELAAELVVVGHQIDLDQPRAIDEWLARGSGEIWWVHPEPDADVLAPIGVSRGVTQLTGEQGDPEAFFGQLNLHLIRMPAAAILAPSEARRGDSFEQVFLKSRIEKAQVSKYSFEQNATPGDENAGLQAQLGYLSDTAASYGSQLRDLAPIDPGGILARLVDEATDADVEQSTIDFLAQQATIVERELASASPNQLLVSGAISAASSVAQGLGPQLSSGLTDDLRSAAAAYTVGPS